MRVSIGALTQTHTFSFIKELPIYNVEIMLCWYWLRKEGGGALFSSNGSETTSVFVHMYLCGVCAFYVSLACVCRLYQTLQSIGLRFIRCLRVRVRATCALHASLINTAATHPAWPRHLVTVNPRAPFFSCSPPLSSSAPFLLLLILLLFFAS